MPLEAAINDDEYTLIYKFTKNLWDQAGGDTSGVKQPDYGRDPICILLRIAVDSSALL